MFTKKSAVQCIICLHPFMEFVAKFSFWFSWCLGSAAHSGSSCFAEGDKQEEIKNITTDQWMFNLGRVEHVLELGLVVPSHCWWGMVANYSWSGSLAPLCPPTLLALPTVLEAKNINFTINIATIEVWQMKFFFQRGLFKAKIFSSDYLWFISHYCNQKQHHADFCTWSRHDGEVCNLARCYSARPYPPWRRPHLARPD